MQPTIGIVGFGSWGSALGQHLANRGCQVMIWGRDKNLLEQASKDRINTKYLPSVVLSKEIRFTTELSAVCQQKLIVLAFPSAELSNLVPKLEICRDSLVLSAIKGFEQASKLTVSEYLQDQSKVGAGVAVISGPTFAADVANNRPCGLVIASKQLSVAETIATNFRTPNMRVFVSQDIRGVEIAAAVKNVIAIAAGACDGLGLGESARAGLITRGLAEMARLAEALGADGRTLAGLSGLGDLIMTATSPTSRNYRVGFFLAQGKTMAQALEAIGGVAEGVSSTEIVLKLAKENAIRVSITSHVAMLLAGRSAKDMISSLLDKPVQNEVE